MSCHQPPVSPDYSSGFGGKYGVQADRVDKSAVGFDYQGKTEKHESQKGASAPPGECPPVHLWPLCRWPWPLPEECPAGQRSRFTAFTMAQSSVV